MNAIKWLAQIPLYPKGLVRALSQRLGLTKLRPMGLHGELYLNAILNGCTMLAMTSAILVFTLAHHNSLIFLLTLFPFLSLAILLIFPNLEEKRKKMKELVSSIYLFDAFATISCASASTALASQYLLKGVNRGALPRFRRALIRMRNGTDPNESLKIEFLEKHYSDWLRAILHGSGSDIIPILSYWNLEVMKGVTTIEDTLAFFIVLSTLMPVIMSISAMVWGLGSSPWIYSLVILQSVVFLGVHLWLKDLILPIV